MIPLVIGTHGRLHRGYLAFLIKRIAAAAVANEVCPRAQQSLYCRRLVLETSVCLQRGNALIHQLCSRSQCKVPPNCPPIKLQQAIATVALVGGAK